MEQDLPWAYICSKPSFFLESFPCELLRSPLWKRLLNLHRVRYFDLEIFHHEDVGFHMNFGTQDDKTYRNGDDSHEHTKEQSRGALRNMDHFCSMHLMSMQV